MSFDLDEGEWDLFLETWPLRRLRNMTLEEYTQAGSTDTFTYWIEARLAKYGSIWGGSSFKFGIYSRKSKEPKGSGKTYVYADDYAWYRRLGDTRQAAFETVGAEVVKAVEAVQAGRLQDIDSLMLWPAVCWKIAFHFQDRLHPQVVGVFKREMLLAFLGRPITDKSTPMHKLQKDVMALRAPDESITAFSERVWETGAADAEEAEAEAEAEAEPLGVGTQPEESGEAQAGARAEPVNAILFGPPGTGKTYRTVDEALAILDREFLHAHKDDRPRLKKRFDQLAAAGRIRFVTFHQSFSYEDFVEGIRAAADEDTGALRYDVEDGVFKELCEAARSQTVKTTEDAIELGGRRIWKMSLGEAISEANIYDDCVANNYLLLGFGEDLDYAGVQSPQEIRHRLIEADFDVKPNDFAVTAIDRFVLRMKVGDLVVVSKGNLKLRAIGEITGEYKHIDRDGGDTYSQSRAVRWLRRYNPPMPYTAVMKNKFSQMSIYELKPSSIDLAKLDAMLAPQRTGAHEPGDYVLIIDEINRGNVSRIFGDLITLIEPSKRKGAPEALEVLLPYSKERFSVPPNLHLIGTMNTADRSLAGLDVALRRRFRFLEFFPKPSLLADLVVEGVNIGELLRVMNHRIEVLMGRDYMLGHAYFLGLRKTPTIEALAAVFRDRILPLLQEYFYDDWQKIAWVLNDHRKPANTRFVVQTGVHAELFGNEVDLPNGAQVWRINAGAFSKPEAYVGIISAPEASA